MNIDYVWNALGIIYRLVASSFASARPCPHSAPIVQIKWNYNRYIVGLTKTWVLKHITYITDAYHILSVFGCQPNVRHLCRKCVCHSECVCVHFLCVMYPMHPGWFFFSLNCCLTTYFRSCQFFGVFPCIRYANVHIGSLNCLWFHMEMGLFWTMATGAGQHLCRRFLCIQIARRNEHIQENAAYKICNWLVLMPMVRLS